MSRDGTGAPAAPRSTDGPDSNSPDDGDNEDGLSCTFEGPCDPVCAAELTYFVGKVGCCADVYFGMMFGYDHIPAINTWVEGQCGVSTEPGEVCGVLSEDPRDTKQCRDLRYSGFNFVDALQCLVA